MASTIFGVAISLVAILYLLARVIGIDQQITLHLSAGTRIGIGLVAACGCIVAMYDLFRRDSTPPMRARLRSKFPAAWPLVGIVIVSSAGAVGYYLTAEVAKILVPYISGSADLLIATVSRSGTAQELYGREQLFDRCEAYLDLQTESYASYRLCARGRGTRQILSSRELPVSGAVVKIAVRTNFLGMYADQILDNPSS